MQALPFGASRSVYGFLRVAHSLWWLGCKALNLVWFFFFDDYITLCKQGEESLVDGVVNQFFKLLGWAVSSNKDSPFSDVFKALGVEISLQNWSEGRILFQNTQKRVNELVETIEGILRQKALPHKPALCVRGKLQFAKAQICGRAAKLGLAAITKHAYECTETSLAPHVADHLRMFIDSLKNGGPRVISGKWESAMFSLMPRSNLQTWIGRVDLEEF